MDDICAKYRTMSISLLDGAVVLFSGEQQPYLIHIIGNFHDPRPSLFIVLILTFKLQDRKDRGVLVA